MQWFADLRLRSKLRLSFAVVLVMTGMLGGFADLKLGAVNAQTHELAHNWMPSIRAVSSLNSGLQGFHADELQYVLSMAGNDRQRYEARMNQAKSQFAGQEAQYMALISSPEEKALWESFKGESLAYLAAHDDVMKAARQNDIVEATQLLHTKSQDHFTRASETLDKLIALNAKGGDEAARAADTTYANARWAIWTAVLMVIGVAMGLSALVANQIAKPVQAAVDVLEGVAEGDLTREVVVTRRDEIGDMQLALQHMMSRLSGMVQMVRTGAESVATASAQIAQGNTDLSARTEDQAASLQQTAASIEQMAGTVRTNADNARQANQLASAASDVALRGGEVVSQVVDTMNGIQSSSQKISDIIGVIDGIAFQTNILALNAAVEAARAGEQGRGFAVVAGEVRSLAQRSAQAARGIKTLINDSVEKVNAGSQLVGTAGATMNDVVGQVRKVTDLVGEIAHASTEQSQGIGQINQAVSQLDQSTQQNAALVEESMAAAASLKSQAEKLAEAVAQFRTGEQAQEARFHAATVIHQAQRSSADAMTSAMPAATPSRSAPAPRLSAPTPQAGFAKPVQAGGDQEWETF